MANDNGKKIKPQDKKKALKKFETEAHNLVYRQRVRIEENNKDIADMQKEISYLQEENNLRRSAVKNYIEEIRAGKHGEDFRNAKISPIN